MGTKISGDDLIEYIQQNYSFKIIESDQSCNVYRSNINSKTKIKHMRYQHLLRLTSPRLNIKPDEDNLIIKTSYYDKDGLIVNGYRNVLMQLKCIVRFINKKRLRNIIVFHHSKRKLCWERLFRYKRI